MEKNVKKDAYIYTCIYVKLSHFAIQQKLTQHCKSTILQLKKKISIKLGFHLSSEVSPSLKASPSPTLSLGLLGAQARDIWALGGPVQPCSRKWSPDLCCESQNPGGPPGAPDSEGHSAQGLPPGSGPLLVASRVGTFSVFCWIPST